MQGIIKESKSVIIVVVIAINGMYGNITLINNQ